MNQQLIPLIKIFSDTQSNNNQHNDYDQTKIINFLSPTSGIGTSTFIFNLFFLLAQLENKKILLADTTGKDFFDHFNNNKNDTISFISENIEVDFLNASLYGNSLSIIEHLFDIKDKNTYNLIIVNTNLACPLSFFQTADVNFITSSLDPISISQCDSVLTSLSKKISVNIGLFILNISETQHNTSFLDTLHKNIFLKHNNIKLCGHSFNHQVLNTANERKKSVFINLTHIDETSIYKEYKNNVAKFSEFISSKNEWLARKAQ